LSSWLASVAVGLAVVLVHGALTLALHGLASSAIRRGAPRWLPRLPLLALSVVGTGSALVGVALAEDHAPLGLVAGAGALVLAWLLYGATVALLLHRRF
jgi:hypothetical protein